MHSLRQFAAFALLTSLWSCTAFFFTGTHYPDRSRPVVMIDTRKGTELGATTTEGILFLNQGQAEGSCQVHLFLGDIPIIEDGVIQTFGSAFSRAIIDLKHQAVPILTREVGAQDSITIIHMQGEGARYTPAFQVKNELVEGDVLHWPGEDIPLGAGVFVNPDAEHPAGYRFAGLITGEVTYADQNGKKRYLVFAGPSHLRKALALPRASRPQEVIRHRPDGISVRK